MGLTRDDLASAISVSSALVEDVLQGRRAIDAEMDLRLARYLGLSDGFFMGLQADHDILEQRRRIGPQLDAITPRLVETA